MNVNSVNISFRFASNVISRNRLQEAVQPFPRTEHHYTHNDVHVPSNTCMLKHDESLTVPTNRNEPVLPETVHQSFVDDFIHLVMMIIFFYKCVQQKCVDMVFEVSRQCRFFCSLASTRYSSTVGNVLPLFHFRSIPRFPTLGSYPKAGTYSDAPERVLPVWVFICYCKWLLQSCSVFLVILVFRFRRLLCNLTSRLYFTSVGNVLLLFNFRGISRYPTLGSDPKVGTYSDTLGCVFQLFGLLQSYCVYLVSLRSTLCRMLYSLASGLWFTRVGKWFRFRIMRSHALGSYPKACQSTDAPGSVFLDKQCGALVLIVLTCMYFVHGLTSRQCISKFGRIYTRPCIDTKKLCATDNVVLGVGTLEKDFGLTTHSGGLYPEDIFSLFLYCTIFCC